MPQPGKTPPLAMRTTSDTAWARKNSGSICKACTGVLNHSRRRLAVTAANINRE
ncbi:hypothetical protein D3C81_2261710 [compost metagenome]